MDDYRWFDYANQSLLERFPFNLGWLAGAREWHDGLLSLQRGAALTPSWLEDIRQAGRGRPPPHCPRVFVSHRQVDDKPARRIAWVAWTKGLDYWLDVLDLDPSRNQQVVLFERWLRRPLTSVEKGIITAAIIEMALLNCTHVLAVMTSNTAGSQWVPYEYGRVKVALPIVREAAAWHDSTSLQLSDLPEYLHLGSVLPDETAIGHYFQASLAAFHSCHGVPRGTWPDPTPSPLPTG